MPLFTAILWFMLWVRRVENCSSTKREENWFVLKARRVVNFGWRHGICMGRGYALNFKWKKIGKRKHKQRKERRRERQKERKKERKKENARYNHGNLSKWDLKTKNKKNPAQIVLFDNCPIVVAVSIISYFIVSICVGVNVVFICVVLLKFIVLISVKKKKTTLSLHCAQKLYWECDQTMMKFS